MFFNVSREIPDFSPETLKNTGRPGYEASRGHLLQRLLWWLYASQLSSCIK